MTLDEMWERLEAHQPFADKRGYGPAWKQMCQDRTRQTAEAVGDALWKEHNLNAAWAAWSAGWTLRNVEQVLVHLNKSEEA
jgi:hypothetical protein